MCLICWWLKEKFHWRRRFLSLLKSTVQQCSLHQGVGECRGNKWTEVTPVMGQQSQVEPHWEMAGCRGKNEKTGPQTWGQKKAKEEERDSGLGGRGWLEQRKEKWEKRGKGLYSGFNAHLSWRWTFCAFFPGLRQNGCLTVWLWVGTPECVCLICSVEQDDRWGKK